MQPVTTLRLREQGHAASCCDVVYATTVVGDCNWQQLAAHVMGREGQHAAEWAEGALYHLSHGLRNHALGWGRAAPRKTLDELAASLAEAVRRFGHQPGVEDWCVQFVKQRVGMGNVGYDAPGLRLVNRDESAGVVVPAVPDPDPLVWHLSWGFAINDPDQLKSHDFSWRVLTRIAAVLPPRHPVWLTRGLDQKGAPHWIVYPLAQALADEAFVYNNMLTADSLRADRRSEKKSA